MTSDRVHEQWAERSGEYSPDYYAYYGPDERSELVRGALDRVVEPETPVLEVGCSSGRHLAHLHRHGYGELHGVDVNAESFDVMRDAYPELADAGTFRVAAIEDVVSEFDDDAFGAVYSVQTLQHVPPENEWVFDELVRVARDLLVTVEVEGDDGDGDGPSSPDADERREPGSPSGPAAESASDPGADAGPSSTRGVNYVTEEIPLYYRNWATVFGERGLVEVDSEPVDADTFRAFRPPSE